MRHRTKKTRPRVKIQQVFDHLVVVNVTLPPLVVTITPPPVTRNIFSPRRYFNVALWLVKLLIQFVLFYLQ